MFVFRRGWEAKNADRLIAAVEQAHGAVFNKQKPGRAVTPESSMWRDINIFNEVGIPSVQYGPAGGQGGGNFFLTLDDAVKAAKVYALTALELCNQSKR
jgi:hypothetical protein